MSGSVNTVLFHGQNVTFWPWTSTVRNRPWTSIQDLFQPNSWQTPVAAVTVYSTPDDGRKGRPKHVEHTCSFNKHNTARVASCWFVIYYTIVQVLWISFLFLFDTTTCFGCLYEPSFGAVFTKRLQGKDTIIDISKRSMKKGFTTSTSKLSSCSTTVN